MKLKAVSGIMLTLLSIGMLILTFNIQPAEATETIYIRADGSIEPSTANITSVDNITYTFTDNINDSIVVERDNIVVEGVGCTIQGTGASGSRGISLSGRSNVTIKNMEIEAFYYGIRLEGSSNTSISGNNITNNSYGIYLESSNGNAISGNTITNNTVYGVRISRHCANNTVSGNNITNNEDGIYLTYYSSNNTISGNTITNNKYGVYLTDFSNNNNTISGNNITNNVDGIRLYNSSYNTISGNTITNNVDGIHLEESSNNTIYHNNFVDNTEQVHSLDSTNVWNDDVGKGNYWSDYEERYPNATEIDGSGIWDTPYVIDGYNQDNYPIIPEFPTWTTMLLILIMLTVTIAIYKRRLLKTPIQ